MHVNLKSNSDVKRQTKNRRRRKKQLITKRQTRQTLPRGYNKFLHEAGGRFKIHSITGDGNCLFRAMAYFVLGKQIKHAFIRDQVVNYVCENWDRFKNFTSEEEMEAYEKRMSSASTYGGEAEIVAFSEVFGCKVNVFFKDSPGREPLVFGDSSTNCFVLYSGLNDYGHYDVLLPTSQKTWDLSHYKISIDSLRRRTKFRLRHVL
ncbi:OTU domain-containing protein [Caerostris extrusa]|uniref:OTU domain-containing protein n=1 Tax=Caerostris extrusa TaxID=172846 RepID=A0AAV4MR79_CAEEX|nr:OTU domain-containing protein [Caerostris extrusa]